MPSIYDFKPRFQSLLRPLLERLHGAGVTPNGVTLAALAGSLSIGLLLLASPSWPVLLLALPIWLLVRMALNAIDGMMAREFALATPLGAILNELGDVLSDLFLYLPLAVIDAPSRWAVVAFAFGAVLTEFCGLLGQALGGHRQYQGPMGKSDRALWIGLVVVVTWIWPSVRSGWPIFFIAAAALCGLTCFLRLRAGLAEASDVASSRVE